MGPFIRLQDLVTTSPHGQSLLSHVDKYSRQEKPHHDPVLCTRIQIFYKPEEGVVGQYKIPKTNQVDVKAARWAGKLNSIPLNLNNIGPNKLTIYKVFDQVRNNNVSTPATVSLDKYFYTEIDSPLIKDLKAAERGYLESKFGPRFSIDESYYSAVPIIENAELKEMLYFVYNKNELDLEDIDKMDIEDLSDFLIKRFYPKDT